MLPQSRKAPVRGLFATLMVCLSFPSFGRAQVVEPSTDPIVGTWKLNPALTKTSPGMPIPPPSQQNDTGLIELTVTTPNPNGSATSSQLAFSARGGVVTGAPSGQMLVETRIGSGDWLVTYLANGVQFLTMRKTISADRKAMRQVVTGISPQGASFEGVLVFDRQ